jgi:hypothetical protein
MYPREQDRNEESSEYLISGFGVGRHNPSEETIQSADDPDEHVIEPDLVDYSDEEDEDDDRPVASIFYANGKVAAAAFDCSSHSLYVKYLLSFHSNTFV